MSRQALHKIVTGRTMVTPETALRLESLFNSKAEHWLLLQLTFDVYQARQRLSAIPPPIQNNEQMEFKLF